MSLTFLWLNASRERVRLALRLSPARVRSVISTCHCASSYKYHNHPTKMHHQHDFSKSLISYRTYLQQDPSQRRLSDFINIIDSLFPLCSTSSTDESLLIALLMTDPKYVAGIFVPATAILTLNPIVCFGIQTCKPATKPMTSGTLWYVSVVFHGCIQTDTV